MRTIRLILIVLIVVVIGVPVVQFVRPIPQLTVAAQTSTATTVPGQRPKIDWPTDGQAALTAVGIGDIGQSGSQTPTPIASVTKVMTAYLTLKKHPLAVGQDGPSVTVTKQDYQTYLDDKAKGESLLPVKVGEKLTERQMLEGLLLPSGNNIATMLANWDDGSLSAFVADMNQTAKSLGMNNTHYADASGYDPASASTAVDQVKLFSKAIQIDAFKTTIGEAQATLPVAGVVYNTDANLGKGNLIGGKTGSTSQAGGCFVFASHKQVGSKNVIIVGAVLGQKHALSILTAALDAGVKLSQEAQATVRQVQVVPANTKVATLNVPWGNSQDLSVSKPVTVIGWPGMKITQKVTPVSQKLGTMEPSNQTVANLEVTVGEQQVNVPLKTTAPVTKPNYLWRLKRL